METIVPLVEPVSLCVYESVTKPLHYISVLAWSVRPDSVVPITPFGRSEPGGAWLIHDACGNFITSDGQVFRDQSLAVDWLRQRSAA
jgi:hypothetical protein